MLSIESIALLLNVAEIIFDTNLDAVVNTVAVNAISDVSIALFCYNNRIVIHGCLLIGIEERTNLVLLRIYIEFPWWYVTFHDIILTCSVIMPELCFGVPKMMNYDSA